MGNNEYAVYLLADKVAELEKKKGEDKDINIALDCLIKQISDAISELQGHSYK